MALDRTTIADDLVTQVARASAAMVFTYSSQTIPVAVPEKLKMEIS